MYSSLQISRRQFLKASSVIGAGLALAGCSVATEDASTEGSADSASTAPSGDSAYRYGKVDIPGKGGSLCNAPLLHRLRERILRRRRL